MHTKKKRKVLSNWWWNSFSAQGIASAFEARVRADGGVYEASSCQVAQIEFLKTLGFYDKASLVLTANGYKEDKLYSLIPSSGAADFTFTRATTATRKGSSVIEPVPYNLVSRSEEFDNVYWVKQNATIIANQISAPNGTLTGDLMYPTTTGTFRGVRPATFTIGALSTYTISIYAKAQNKNYLGILDPVGGAVVAWFNLTNGTIGTTVAPATSTITAVGNGWYRCTMTRVAANSSGVCYFVVTDADNTTTATTNSTDGIYLWGAQYIQGTLPLDYFKTTDRLDVPRLDYTAGSCPSILLEPQKTNLLLRSEEFDNVAWLKSNATTVANSTVAPDGLTTADSVLETTANAGHDAKQLITKAASAIQYTFSVFVKSNQRDWIRIVASNDTSGTKSVFRFFNISTGAVGTSTGAATWTLQDSKIEAAANGFYRCTITFTTDTDTNLYVWINSATADGTASFAGDITKGFYSWGAQLETGSYATSYIPTTSATVTRVADAVTALTGVSSLIGQTEGTISIEGSSFADGVSKQFSISDGTLNNRIIIALNGSNNIDTSVITGGVIQANVVTAFVSNTIYKIAVTYQANKVALFVNGVKIGQDLSATIPTCSRIGFDSGSGTLPIYGNFKMITLSKTVLSDAEAIALTTP